MKRKYWIFGGSALAVLIILILLVQNSDSEYEAYTAKVMRRNIVQTVTASGKIQPETDLKITSDVSGEITELYVKEGQPVKKGDLICRIRPDVYLSAVERTEALLKGTEAGVIAAKAQLKQAEANLELTKNNYDRIKKLFDKDVVSRQEYENALSQYESAKANYQALEAQINTNVFSVKGNEASLKEARSNLERTFIYAPVDGTIYRLNVEKGERVQGVQGFQGTEILRMANLNEMQVVVDVNENDILKIKRGDSARVEVDAHSGRIFKGVVTEVGTSANTGSLTTDQAANYQVKIRILKESYADLIAPDAPHPFLPGMSASVDIITQRAQNVLSVPVQAVSARDAKVEMKSESSESVSEISIEKNTQKDEKLVEVVFLAREGKAIKTAVKTGIQDMDYIEIREGLKENDEVISGPYSLISRILQGNEKIRVVPEDKLSDGAYTE